MTTVTGDRGQPDAAPALSREDDAIVASGGKRRAIEPTTAVGKAMAVMLPPRVTEILSHEGLARQRDVDGVHDMRVATKRLREATRVFRPAFGKQRMARHLERLERLNDALGRPRELDVLVLELEDLAARAPKVAAGLAPLVARLKAEGQAASTQLTSVLDEALPGLAGDIRQLLRDRPKGRGRVWKMPFAQLGCRTVAQRVQAAVELEAAARIPEAESDFHRLRIAVKRVKYALELFLDVLGKPARRAYKPLAELQELMGEVHDRDVLRRVLRDSVPDTLDAETCSRALALADEDRARLHAQTMDLLDRMSAEKICKKLLAACR